MTLYERKCWRCGDVKFVNYPPSDAARCKVCAGKWMPDEREISIIRKMWRLPPVKKTRFRLSILLGYSVRTIEERIYEFGLLKGDDNENQNRDTSVKGTSR